jgi:hypothetical protein
MRQLRAVSLRARAGQVRGVDSLLELAGAQLSLGVAGRREQSVREEALVRRLRGERALVVLDDWHALAAPAQAGLARLVKAFPPNVRVIITTRGATGSAAAKELQRALPGALGMGVAGLACGPAQRVFYLHMMRCSPRPTTPCPIRVSRDTSATRVVAYA